MKVIHLSYWDQTGGAARAAFRLHKSLIDRGVESKLKVRVKNSDDWTVEDNANKILRIFEKYRIFIGVAIQRLQRNSTPGFRSGNWLPSNWSAEINKSNYDLVHLHWVAGETLSIEDIGRIKKPIVWTFHDTWPFCGNEHVASVVDLPLYSYDSSMQNNAGSGLFNLSKFVWQRKKRSWSQSMYIIAPSQWMADCARSSLLFKNSPTSVIPNLLDTMIYKPLDINFSREALNLPKDKKIVVFGAIGGAQDYNKGYDLLIKSLSYIDEDLRNELICVVFGQSKPKNQLDIDFELRWLGHIHDDVTLAMLYSAADVMIVPSRQEAFGQTASEAQACGCPVVAFNCTGLPDVVEHKVTGYLAEPYDPKDLANGIKWILDTSVDSNVLRENARTRAVRLWSEEVVVSQYLDLYNKVLKLESIS